MIHLPIWICFADGTIVMVRNIIEENSEDGTTVWRLMIDVSNNDKIKIILKSKFNIDANTLPNNIYQKKYPASAFRQTKNPYAHIRYFCDCSFDGTILDRVSEQQRVSQMESDMKTLLGIIATQREKLSKLGAEEDVAEKRMLERLKKFKGLVAPVFIQPRKTAETGETQLMPSE